MTRRGKKDGKGTEGSIQWAVELQKLGASLLKANRLPRLLDEQGIDLKALKFVCKDDDGSDWLCVLTADTDEGAIVAFHGGSSLADVLSGVVTKVEREEMRYKSDEYSRKTT